MLKALAYLSDFDYIHSDIKLDNILIDCYLPHVRIIDLGCGLQAGREKQTNVQAIYYRAPEVVLGIPYAPSLSLSSSLFANTHFYTFLFFLFFFSCYCSSGYI